MNKRRRTTIAYAFVLFWKRVTFCTAFFYYRDMRNGVTEWEKLTTKECEITYFEGNHFYLFDNMPNIFDYICRTVEMYNNI